MSKDLDTNGKKDAELSEVELDAVSAGTGVVAGTDVVDVNAGNETTISQKSISPKVVNQIMHMVQTK